VPAEPGQLRDRLGLGVDPLGAQQAAQQELRLAGGQYVQVELGRAVEGDQPAQPVAAGDQDQAAGAGRQQRADLLGVAGVVQHDQHAPVRQHAAVQRRRLVHPIGNLLGRHAQRRQEPGQRVDRP
jgi:hypothetical protein